MNEAIKFCEWFLALGGILPYNLDSIVEKFKDYN